MIHYTPRDTRLGLLLASIRRICRAVFIGYFNCSTCGRPMVPTSPDLHFGNHRAYCADCWGAALLRWLKQ